MESLHEKCQKIVEEAVDNKKIFGTSFCIKYLGKVNHYAAGNLQKDSCYFIASTTKLFTTSVILHLYTNRQLNLEDPIEHYLSNDILQGLHIFKGKDYSKRITIKQLLAHTSGLPDYFQGKDSNGYSLEKSLLKGNDQKWTFEDAIKKSKHLRPLFAPDTPKKAKYSDTNFQLLGKIAENITQQSIAENYERLIFNPLGLSQTYLYQDEHDRLPKTLYYKSKPLPIPQAMSSFGPDGSIVSTSYEMILFLEAFSAGMFFNKNLFPQLKIWNPIFFPLQSGIGLHRFKLPWFFNPTGAIPELIGHSGLSGALAFYNPEQDLFIAGTVNQVARPDLSFKLAIKLIQQYLKKRL